MTMTSTLSRGDDAQGEGYVRSLL